MRINKLPECISLRHLSIPALNNKRNLLLRAALVISAAVISFTASACKEEFNPRDNLKDKYILTCIIRGDSEKQSAFLSRSYDAEGNNPYINTADPSVLGAEIKVWQQDSVYIFKSSSFLRTDSSRYGAAGNQYSASFSAEPGASLEIEALTSNGKRLHGYTSVPSMIYRDYHYTDTIIPPVGKDYFYLAWTSKNVGLYYIPMIRIYYYKSVNGKDVILEKPVAIGYKNENGKISPQYPPAQPLLAYTFDMSDISKAMREISEGDANKANYKILSMIVDVYALDRNLSAFYSAGKLTSDGYSITVDQPDFSNIEGGFGIFGSYVKREFSILFSKQYINSFGYLPALP